MIAQHFQQLPTPQLELNCPKIETKTMFEVQRILRFLFNLRINCGLLIISPAKFGCSSNIFQVFGFLLSLTRLMRVNTLNQSKIGTLYHGQAKNPVLLERVSKFA